MDYRSISPNFISDLTDEDLHMVCDLIPLKHVRTYFKCNPQKFRKICSFSRAEKVSPELAEKLILGHRDDSFISDFVNTELSGFLDVTQTRIAANTESGNDIHTAFLQVFYSLGDLFISTLLGIISLLENFYAEGGRKYGKKQNYTIIRAS